MSIRDRLKITRRGYSILREYCPGLIETKILFSLIESGPYKYMVFGKNNK